MNEGVSVELFVTAMNWLIARYGDRLAPWQTLEEIRRHLAEVEALYQLQAEAAPEKEDKEGGA